MAIGLGALLKGAMFAAPYALQGVAAGIRRFKRGRNPTQYDRQQILKRVGVTEEQAALRKQNLEEALAALSQPQRIFESPQVRMQAGEDITAGLPQEVGQEAQPTAPRIGSLIPILNAMAATARSGYQEDLARIGESQGPVRNPVGRTSGYQAMIGAARTRRGTDLYTRQTDLLRQYANRSGLAELEAGALNVQRAGAQTQLQNFLEQLRQQQAAGLQSQYLGQRQLGTDQANLRNILEAERYRQGVRQFRIGQQPHYTAQAAPEGI